MAPHQSIERIAIAAIVLACAFALLWAGYETLNRLDFLSRASSALGKVVALTETRPGQPQPQISFRTTSGETITFIRAYRGSAVHVPPVGSSVEVLYLETQPSSAVENEFAALWGSTCIAAAVGLLGFAVVFAGVRAKKRRAQNAF